MENDGSERDAIADDPELPCFVHWPRVDLSQIPDGAWWEEQRKLNQVGGGRRRQAENIEAWIMTRPERRIAIFSHWFVVRPGNRAARGELTPAWKPRGTIEAVSGRSVSNGGPAIEYVFAMPEHGVPSRRWAWTHVRKRD